MVQLGLREHMVTPIASIPGGSMFVAEGLWGVTGDNFYKVPKGQGLMGICQLSMVHLQQRAGVAVTHHAHKAHTACLQQLMYLRQELLLML